MHETIPNANKQEGRKHRPPEGLCRPRPATPSSPLGRLLLALEVEPCTCHVAHRAEMADRRKCDDAGGLAEALESVGPPCPHRLRSDHAMPPEAWLELMRRFDAPGMATPRPVREPMTPEEWADQEARVGVYAARVAAGRHWSHPCDRPAECEAPVKREARHDQ